MRVSIPDRPGSLGAVASAMGTVGADITAVELVERLDDAVIEDFMLTLPDAALPDGLVSACNRLDGVDVLWVSHFQEGWGLESDIELLTRMTEEPDDAAAMLTDSAPTVFHCHWALLADRATGRIEFSTELAPELSPEQLESFGPLDEVGEVVMPEGWLPHWGESVCVLAPMRNGRVVVLGRQGGPSWLGSEKARLGFLAAIAP